jgi:hypothetical protein
MQQTSLPDLAAKRNREDIGRIISARAQALGDPHFRKWPEIFYAHWPGSMNAEAIRQNHERVMKTGVPAMSPATVDLAPTQIAAELGRYAQAGSILDVLKTKARNVPFAAGVVGELTAMSGGAWGDGTPIPVSAHAFTDPQPLPPLTHSVLAVVARKLARFTDNKATGLLRDVVADTERRALDFDLLDPNNAGIDGQKPSSLTAQGSPVLSASGSDLAAAKADLVGLLTEARERGMGLRSSLFLMSSLMAAALRSLGDPFLDCNINGGSVFGIPVGTSDEAPNDVIVLADGARIFVADSDAVEIAVSTGTSIQLLDNPTNDSRTTTATAHVSMFQTNSIAIRGVRRINWAVLPGAVIFISGAAYGGAGSPA